MVEEESIGRNIEIIEIKNGYTIKFFTDRGSAELDQTRYAKTINQALKAIREWNNLVELQIKLKPEKKRSILRWLGK